MGERRCTDILSYNMAQGERLCHDRGHKETSAAVVVFIPYDIDIDVMFIE